MKEAYVICSECKIAGNANAEGNYKAAKKSHDKCQWPSGGCFCQHAVGEVYVGRFA